MIRVESNPEGSSAYPAILAVNQQEHDHTTTSSSCMTEGRRPHILLGVSGSVAAIKLPLLCQQLLQHGELKVIATKSARHFPAPDLPVPVLGDEDEWRDWQKVGDPVLHIDLRHWADVLVVAPLSANTLAKMAHGLCDNLLTCVVRAWDFKKPLLVAPAMNTLMWDSPFTQQHLDILTRLGASIIPPIAKKLACGDVGIGAMAEPAVVVKAVAAALPAGE